MAIARLFEVLLLVGVIMCGTGLEVKALSMDYYAMTCPCAEMMVRNTVNQALQYNPSLAAKLLRMHFHDCFVEGCDGSILIDSTNDNIAEKASPANFNLQGYEIIDWAKGQIEKQCPGVVSCADILAMAARDAVQWAGGPSYDIPKGRKDGRRSNIQDTRNLPPPTFNSTELINAFSQRGFTVQELVALSGGHTLGVARCASFKNRLSEFDSTHDVDPSLDSNLAMALSRTCTAGDNTTVSFDYTATSFDNGYFSAVRMNSALLTSDQTLFLNPETQVMVNNYAMNQGWFFYHFSQAIVKMGLLDVKEGNQGEVRSNCRVIN